MEKAKLDALIALADDFDAAGNHKEAEAIDNVLKIVAEKNIFESFEAIIDNLDKVIDMIELFGARYKAGFPGKEGDIVYSKCMAVGKALLGAISADVQDIYTAIAMDDRPGALPKATRPLEEEGFNVDLDITSSTQPILSKLADKVIAARDIDKLFDNQTALYGAVNTLRSTIKDTEDYDIDMDSKSVDAVVAAVETLSKQVSHLKDLVASTQPILSKLADIADKLDEAGVVEAATKVDELIVKIAKEAPESERAYDFKYHREQQVRQPKPKKEEKSEYHVKPYNPIEHSLSSRHCPDHLGSMLARVSEGVWQCALDGKTYCWETGYTTQDGVQVPGGSVAAMTPNATDYQQNDSRIFDSRDKVLNTIN